MKKQFFSILFLVFTFYLFSNPINDIIDKSIRFNNWQEAKNQLELYIKSNTTDSRGYALYASVLNELKLYDEAIIAIRSAINYESSTEKKGEYYFNLGNYYYSNKLYDIAEEMYEKSISQNKILAQPYYMIGLIRYNKNDIENCINYWKNYILFSTDREKKQKISEIIGKLGVYLEDEKKRIEDERIRAEEERLKREEYLKNLKEQLGDTDREGKNLLDYRINENKKEAEFEDID